MLCPKCGNQNPDTAQYCRYCGDKLDETTAGAPRQSSMRGGRTCRSCGAALPEGARFCRACGAAVSVEPEPAPKPKPRKKSQFWQNFLIAAASIAMLFAIVVGALYATGHLDDIIRAFSGERWKEPPGPDPEPTPEPTPEPSPEPAPDPEPAPSPEPDPEPEPEPDPLPEPPIPAPVDDVPALAQAEPLTSEELEDAVADIRVKYNTIRDGITAGAYRTVFPRTGVTYYFSGNELVAVVMLKNVDDCAYSRSYYYSGGSVFFSYYEAADAYRLYVHDGRLIRLHYTPEAASNDIAVNHDQESSEKYQQWEELILSEARSLYLTSLSSASSEYILPDSDSRYLTEDDLIGLSAEQCRLARNEIYARHGRRFQDAGLQRYFDSCSWYSGTVDPKDFSDSVFNEYERANSRLIVEYERAHGYTK